MLLLFFFVCKIKALENYIEREGKIPIPLADSIHVTVLTMPQYISSQILRMRSPIIDDIVRYRYAFYHIKL